MDNKTDGLERYLNRRLNVLLSSGVRPIMVFDGRSLPLKRGVDEKRRQSREMHLQKAYDLLGKHGRNDSVVRSNFRAGFVVTYELAQTVIGFLRIQRIEYIVAPYEADAQLAFMTQSGLADIAISEDSDLIPFGCTRILYKLEENGYGCLVEKENFQAMSKLKGMYSMDRFRWMCIMAGCDYFSGIPGIGLVKARKILQLIRKDELKEVLRCVRIRLGGSVKFSERDFEFADLAFKHQVIYDPRCGRLKHLREWTQDVNQTGIEQFGEFFGDDIAYQQAIGNYDYVRGRVECARFEMWRESLLWDKLDIDTVRSLAKRENPTGIGIVRCETVEHVSPVQSQEDSANEPKRSQKNPNGLHDRNTDENQRMPSSVCPVTKMSPTESLQRKQRHQPQRNRSPILICGAILQTDDRISFEETPFCLPEKPDNTLSCSTSPYFAKSSADQEIISQRKRTSLFTADPSDQRPWKQRSIFTQVPAKSESDPIRRVGLQKTRNSIVDYLSNSLKESDV